ncbi:MAG: acetyl-CoA carboxylase biotin carboxyl carrier protein [Gammaproteobacteria bacterium]|jgi:acetyl-CoA carboxylase biotin carboxyl carrier protein
MDIRKVKKLIELLEESDLAEIEITEGDDSVRISRHSKAPVPPAAPALAQVMPGPAMAASTGADAIPDAPAPQPDGSTINAPMVGTYYASQAPGAKPFVEVGSEVQVGDVLCIIEAMKMMNQIEAEQAGRIVSVLVENGEPVEFGQPLFIIE